jgi:hypothetical protein
LEAGNVSLRQKRHRSPSSTTDRGFAAVELAIRKTADPTSGGLIMQRNKVHHVYTVERVARDLGVGEALIQDLTLGLSPKTASFGSTARTMRTGSWPSLMKASRKSNSSSKNIIASPHRKLDPSTAVHERHNLRTAPTTSLRDPKRALMSAHK